MLNGRQSDSFQICLRLQKKKIITVILDTNPDVLYSSLDSVRWRCRSYATCIAEVEHAGRRQVEHAGKAIRWVRPPDTGYGFLWRLNSHWRFEEKDNCGCVERCASSVTRNVPKELGWIIEPMIDKLPGEITDRHHRGNAPGAGRREPGNDFVMAGEMPKKPAVRGLIRAKYLILGCIVAAKT